MASQSYIIAREDIIVGACARARDGQSVDMESTRLAMRESREAWDIESRAERNAANRDLWGTLGVNVHCLGRFCPELCEECRDLASVLGVHVMGRDRY